MSGRESPERRWYFTTEEMLYMANLVTQQPYAHVKKFMEKIDMQLTKAQQEQEPVYPDRPAPASVPRPPAPVTPPQIAEPQ